MTVLDPHSPPQSQAPEPDTDLLIIGAGPFGLALAAHSRDQGTDHLVVGKPMEFWQDNMPSGMYLRSASDWHLDPSGGATIERFLEERGKTPESAEPLSRQMYLDYTRWFQEQKGISPLPEYVQQLDGLDGDGPLFRATLENGRTLTARNVAVAVGFKYFKHEPRDLVERLPAGRFSHTCDHVDFTDLAGKRVLILGGRQSAYEWAALLCETGAGAVHLSHRHDSPAYAEADWSWVGPLVDAMVDDPAWFRTLSPDEQNEVRHRLWAEGRLKVEPWLETRVLPGTVRVWPRSELVSCEEGPDGTLNVTLNHGGPLAVDHVILATGYRVQIDRVPFLARGNLLPRLAIRDGFPVLDPHFQTSILGLFITSMAAAQDFGPFFGFTISVRTSARLIGRALTAGLVPR